MGFISETFNLYLSAHGRYNRWQFGLIVFVAFLPALIWQLMAFMNMVETGRQQVQQFSSVLEQSRLGSLQNLTQGMSDAPNRDMREQLGRIEASRDATRQAMGNWDPAYRSPRTTGSFKKGVDFPVSKFLQLLGFLALYPAIIMRLRDISGSVGSLSGNGIFVLTALPSLLSVLRHYNIELVGWFLSPLLSFIAFVLLLYLSMAGSSRYIPPSQRNTYE